MLHGYKKVHFVGIGGIGMSGLAEILLTLGYRVSGSDLVLTEVTQRLHHLGAVIHNGHAASNVDIDVDLVVYSAAVSAMNPELVVAKERGIPVISRGDMLADITRLKKHVVAVAGAHGKTTTTSMIYHIMAEADVESTVIIGGILMRQGHNAFWGRGDYLVAETDEHDRSFLKLFPTVSVVTNIDLEHMEHYESLDDLKQAFLDFIHKVPFYGFSVLCYDDVHVRSILPKVEAQVVTYGLSSEADFYAQDVMSNHSLTDPRTEFVFHNSHPRLGPVGSWGRVILPCMGQHNVLNALAALATGIGLGIHFDECVRGLSKFRGIKRRMEVVCLEDDVILIEDYAHHPTEIQAVLRAVQTQQRRKVILFQPHLYSRTQYFAKEFASVLAQADELILLPIYPAREEPIPGVTSDMLLELVQQHGLHKVHIACTFQEAYSSIRKLCRPQDLLLILGAGDIYHVAKELKKHEKLQARIMDAHATTL